ncbi:prepilin-type N-terminal cleavage/methylation domain-containing protein [Psychromonas hadalis]|uniref:prepilin-type N-terminal cleavage/methylation domain-containing protein n=1 Tax=Psychromonas hadalis TaxID=211669 RepID=UPI0003B4D676|nr:prepilin-type N-terminal cleavage/methylation domain-containing protein [Psychromonas hadalis]
MHLNKRGFTLVELVVGIVVLAIAMMIMNTMLISQSKDALEPLYRLRASQLGQSIMQDILSRAYDENSDHNGGLYRCGEVWFSNASETDCSSGTGTDSIAERDGGHQNFNDVDDFITDGFESAVSYGDVLGGDLPPQYNNYAVKIEVVSVTANISKKIAVIIKTPSGEKIRFSALKGNY